MTNVHAPTSSPCMLPMLTVPPACLGSLREPPPRRFVRLDTFLPISRQVSPGNPALCSLPPLMIPDLARGKQRPPNWVNAMAKIMLRVRVLLTVRSLSKEMNAVLVAGTLIAEGNRNPSRFRPGVGSPFRDRDDAVRSVRHPPVRGGSHSSSSWDRDRLPPFGLKAHPLQSLLLLFFG